MSEQLPQNNEEITPEQVEEFVAKIESLRPLLGENMIHTLPVENVEGDAMYTHDFSVEGKDVEVTITNLSASADDAPEKITSSDGYAVIVSSEEKEDDVTVKTKDEYSIQRMGEGLGDVVVFRQAMSVQKGQNPFEEVIGNKQLFRELMEEHGDITQASLAYHQRLLENEELNEAAGVYPNRFTQDRFKEVMSILEQIG